MATPQHTSRIEFDGADVGLPTDVAQQTLIIVNVAYVGEPGSNEWTLVDAGIPGMAARIIAFARERFGDAPPRAILLTHGHFDHVGSLRALLAEWPDVPVYAHPLEMPYLTGKSSYPPPDPTVGGGLMARSASLFPSGPHDFSDRVQTLPQDGSAPTLAGWRWIATPGHSPGHVSFYRDDDGTLIVGDAFIMQKQESLLGVLTAAPTLRGPPTYFTPDWDNARKSVQALAALRASSAVTGHGHALVGTKVADDIAAMAERFDEQSLPKKGRYVSEPAMTDESGVVSAPEKPADPFTKLAIVGGLVGVGVIVALLANRKQCASRADVARGSQIDPCDE